MPDVDPLILELRVEAGRARAELRSYADDAQRRFDQLESQMRRQSGAISDHIRGLAGSLGTLFTGRELVGMLDSFTRMQNSIRVAGDEGEALKATQDRLFESAQKYGVELEGLAGLYSTTAQAAKGFGASQQDVFRVTDAVSAALKITGQTSQQASGALLQLGQAFRSPKVQAEEFNSLIDGMYPLLQAAAEGSDRWRGNVNKLIADVKKGTVTGQEFFNAVAAGSEVLEKRAAQATLTLAAGMTTLTNALTVYFGEADKANGVSEALGYALNKLADNIDVIIPGLAAIVAIIGVRYVAALTASIARSVGLSVASLGLAVSLNGVGAAATLAGTRLLAAFGGPVGIAIAGLVLGIGYLVAKSGEATKATGVFLQAQQASEESTRNATDAIEKLVTAKGKARDAALAEARAEAEAIKQKLASARASVVLAKAELVRAKAYASAQNQASVGSTGMPGTGLFIQGQGDKARAQAQGNLAAAEKAVATNQKALDLVESQINAVSAPKVNPGDTSTAKRSRTRSGQSEAERGRRAARAAAQVQDEFDRMGVDMLRTRAELTRSAEDRAVAELAALSADRSSFDRQLKLDEDLTATDRERLTLRRDAADAERRRAILIQASEDLARERFDRESAANDLEAETVSAAGRVKDRTAGQRKATDLRLIDLEFSQREDEALLEYNAATKRGDEVAADIARSKLARIQLLKKLAEEEAALRNQSPLEAYIDEAPRDAEELSEAFEGVAVNGLRPLNDGLTDAIMNSKSLGDTFKNVAKQIIADLIQIAIRQAIVNTLASAFNIGGGSGGGGIASAFSSIFGRASGGYVAPGQTVRVNEHRGGAEYLRMGSRGGTVIPLGQVNQRVAQPSTQPGGVTVVRLALSGDIDARIDQRSASVAVEVVRATAGEVSDMGAQKALNQLSTPRL